MRKFLFVVMFLVALGYYFANFVHADIDRTVAKYGTETIATTIRRSIYDERSKKSVPKYYLTLQFSIDDGLQRTAEVKVPRSVYEAAASNPQVPIRYFYEGSDKSGEPYIRVKGEEERGSPVMYVAMALLMIAAGVGFGYEFIPEKRGS